MNYGYFIFIFVFITIVGWFLNASGLGTFTYMSTTVFLIGQILFFVIIGVANTPVAKGVGLLAWAGWLFAYLYNLTIPSGLNGVVWAIIIIPYLIAVGFSLLEVGKG